jgi:hypothetical protein
LRAEAEQDLASVRTIFLRLGLSETAVTIDSAELR